MMRQLIKQNRSTRNACIGFADLAGKFNISPLAKALTTLAIHSFKDSCWRVRKLAQLTVLGISVLLGACATSTPEDPYVLFREHMPRSILLLPPINESVDVEATYSWLTTASKPIAEQGFYVFPVAIVDEFMKENGLPHPEDMHAAPLDKFGEIFGADAVMYVTIEDFGQKFQLVQSTTTVYARAELVDVKTGQSIWASRVDYSQSNNNVEGGGLLGAVIGAAVAQVGESITDSTHDAARLANYSLFVNGYRPTLLLGPSHPGFEEQMTLAAEVSQELLNEEGESSLELPVDAPAE